MPLSELLRSRKSDRTTRRAIRETEPIGVNIVSLTPDHYTDFNELAQSAWPGVSVNAEHDFVAITDHGVSLAATENNKLLGASLNLIKPSEQRGSYHLLIHMLGTKKEAQGKGVGSKLMQTAYTMVRSGQLGEQVKEVRLTSDPLELGNVMFYLHHHGMHVSTYKPDAYKSLKTGGAQQHLGLPADRFLYACEPASKWVKQRELPSAEEYRQTLQLRPEIALHPNTSEALYTAQIGLRNILLVEVPGDIAEVKSRDMQAAYRLRVFHQTVFSEAFNRGYAAVDATTLETAEGTKSYIVLMHGFNEKDPQCLRKAVSSLNHK